MSVVGEGLVPATRNCIVQGVARQISLLVCRDTRGDTSRRLTCFSIASKIHSVHSFVSGAPGRAPDTEVHRRHTMTTTALAYPVLARTTRLRITRRGRAVLATILI